MMTIGSLFSGIGGLELGLEMAGLGPVKWQVEIDDKCRQVLARHWPEATRYDDVKTLDTARIAPVDLVCGGFPCQDLSSAGKRAGLAGHRSGLWHEFARVVAGCRPRFVVVENVKSGAKNWVDAVCRDLGKLGYASLPIPIAASDCGAPHERARVFIVGARAANGHDAKRSAHAATQRRSNVATAIAAGVGGSSPDAHGTELLRLEHRRERGTRRQGADESATALTHAHVQPSDVRPAARGAVRDVSGDGWWAAEPGVARVVHGLSGRMDRTRMLGNAVVPQCAEVIGHVIRQLTVMP